MDADEEWRERLGKMAYEVDRKAWLELGLSAMFGLENTPQRTWEEQIEPAKEAYRRVGHAIAVYTLSGKVPD